MTVLLLERDKVQSVQEEILDQIENLKNKETSNGKRWNSFLEKIGRSDLKEVLDLKHPMIYSSAEYMLPGTSGDGGLGALARDHYLEAANLGYPGIFFGLFYLDKKTQIIPTDYQGHFWQEVKLDKLPDPEELGMDRVNNMRVIINTRSRPNTPIPVYRHPLSTDRTPLFLFTVFGGVYPNENNSNERLWNDTVLGFGQQQIISQLTDKGMIKSPSFFHINESAMIFAALSQLDDLTGVYGNTYEVYEKALKEVRNKVILTNHTLVPAAEASFSKEQCEEIVFPNIKNQVVKNRLYEFIDSHGGRLTLLDLAFHLAGKCNGVSMDHAARASKIFKRDFYAVTNGIFEEGWAPQTLDVLKKHRVIDQFGLPLDNFPHRVLDIPKRDLIRLKNTGVRDFQNYLLSGNRRDQFGNIVEIPEDAIIIGDARRYADYKRRKMIFTHPDVLEKMLIEHPKAHLIISGKAHPNDYMLKDDLSQVLNTIAGNRIFSNQIHFLPNWDPGFAQHLFPATHVWLNYPRVGYEACGTSGMKAGLNGALLVSTIDGFFVEMNKKTFYAVEGASDTPEEYNSFYANLLQAVNDAENPDRWVEHVKRLWQGEFLKIASGARMLGQYTQMALPK
jgi:glycogen phosphorylase